MLFYRLGNNNKTDQGDGGFGKGGIEKDVLEREGVKELHFV
jgi:hypothetical protein